MLVGVRVRTGIWALGFSFPPGRGPNGLMGCPSWEARLWREPFIWGCSGGGGGLGYAGAAVGLPTVLHKVVGKGRPPAGNLQGPGSLCQQCQVRTHHLGGDIAAARGKKERGREK